MPRAWAGPTGHPREVPRCVASLTPQNCPSRGLDGEWGVRVRVGTGRARLGGVLKGLPEVRTAPGGPEPGVAWAAGSGLERSICPRPGSNAGCRSREGRQVAPEPERPRRALPGRRGQTQRGGGSRVSRVHLRIPASAASGENSFQWKF